jgi:hypothetical protein
MDKSNMKNKRVLEHISRVKGANVLNVYLSEKCFEIKNITERGEVNISFEEYNFSVSLTVSGVIIILYMKSIRSCLLFAYPIHIFDTTRE